MSVWHTNRRSGVTHLLLTCLLLVFSLALLGCSSSVGRGALPGDEVAGASPALPGATAQPSGKPAGPFAIATPGEIYTKLRGEKHSSSILARDASDFAPGFSQRVSLSTPKAIYSPAWDSSYSPFNTVSYAIYRFDLTARTGQLTIHLLWDMAPKDFKMLWIGASNWQTGLWDWHAGPPGGMIQLADDGMSIYKHPATSEMYVAVVLLGQVSSLLQKVWLTCSLRGDWWMYGRNQSHSAGSPLTGPEYPLLLWQQQVGYGDNFEHPAFAPVYDSEGTLYVGANGPNAIEQQLLAINPDGTYKWQFIGDVLTEDGGFFVPAIDDDGTVYWSVYYGPLYAINHAGEMEWKFSGRYSMFSHPVIGQNGVVYVIGSDGIENATYYLFAVNAVGDQLLEVRLGSGPVEAPVLAENGSLYVTCGTKLLAFTPAGKLEWEFDTGSTLKNSPPSVGPDGRIYLTNDSDPAVFYALNPDGWVEWSYTLPGASSYSASVGLDGMVFVGDSGGLLYAFNSDGQLNWTYRLSLWHAALQPSVDAAGTVYAGSTDGRLYALNADGSLKWRYTAQRPLIDGPAIGEDGTLYFMDNNARLYAVGSSSEETLYTISGYVVDQADAGMAGVAVTVSGVEPVLTDASGYYSVPGLSDGEYLVSPSREDFSFSPVFQLATIEGADLELPSFVGSPAGVPEWPMWGRDGAHTRRSPHTGPDTPVLAWEAYIGQGIPGSPIIGADGALYVQGELGKLVAFNADGSQRWEYNMDHYTEASPALGPDGTIFTNNGGTLMYAVSPGGGLRWTLEAPSVVEGSPIPTSDGLVLQNCVDRLLAVALDGTLSWSVEAYNEQDTGQSPAIAADGTIYYNGGALWPDGTPKGPPSKGGSFYKYGATSIAVADDGTVYHGSGRSMSAGNPDGSNKWSYNVGGNLYSSPAIDALGGIYFGTLGVPYESPGWLVALNADGTLKWETPRETSIDSSPAIDAAGIVYVGLLTGEIRAYNPDGSVKWSYDTGAPVSSSPAIGADGTIYCGGARGWLYALGPGTE